MKHLFFENLLCVNRWCKIISKSDNAFSLQGHPKLTVFLMSLQFCNLSYLILCSLCLVKIAFILSIEALHLILFFFTVFSALNDIEELERHLYALKNVIENLNMQKRELESKIANKYLQRGTLCIMTLILFCFHFDNDP